MKGGWRSLEDPNEDGKEGGEEDRNFKLPKDKAPLIIKELEREPQWEIISLKRQRKREKPPLLHSLTFPQREANHLHEFSAKKTPDIAQKFYQDHKVLSCPRTDAQHLRSSNKEFVRKILQRLGKEELIGRVDTAGKRVFDDSKLTDRHAIIPMAPLPQNVSKVEWEERKTKPPARYTEATLLKVMERLRLGTPATRADITNTLLEREYVVRKGKSLLSTPKGKELISKLKDSRISSPEMTAEWEKELEIIYTQRKGKSGYGRFLEGIKEFVKNEIYNLKSKEFTAPPQATKKMLYLAKSLAKETVLKVPKETDFETIKSFIDKALKEKERQLRIT